MLKRVSIQNFKSLKDVTLDLQKVNLLIGPNNSGKTNFLKALEMINILIKTNKIEDNYRQLTFKRQGGEIFFRYTLNGDWLKADLVTIISINKNVESFSIEDNGTRYIYGYDEEMREKKIMDLPLSISFRKDMLKLVGELFSYTPNTSLIIKPVDLIYEDIVNRDCSNIVPFVFNLNQNHRSNFLQIEKGLQECVGDIVTVSTPLVDTSDGPKLKLKFFDTNNNDYWAEDVSEGVLFFFALLCIINQPNPPKLLLLEEPEKGIHPRRIYEVIQFIFGLADDKGIQVIMTTHSPIVLDMFKDMPESVFIFDKDDEGATHVKNLQRDVIEPDTARSIEYGLEPPHYTDALGDSWTIGFLGGVPK